MMGVREGAVLKHYFRLSPHLNQMLFSCFQRICHQNSFYRVSVFFQLNLLKFYKQNINRPSLSKIIYICFIVILKVLRGFTLLDTTEESEIILISDGENNEGSMENATQNCVDAGVVIHSITVTEAADQVLVDLANKTRGRLLDNNAIELYSLIDVLSNIISGGPNADLKSPVMVCLNFGYINLFC